MYEWLFIAGELLFVVFVVYCVFSYVSERAREDEERREWRQIERELMAIEREKLEGLKRRRREWMGENESTREWLKE